MEDRTGGSTEPARHPEEIMVGIGVLELIIVALVGLFWLAIVGGIVFCVWALASRRGFGPKNCPHCGAELRRRRQPYDQKAQPGA